MSNTLIYVLSGAVIGLLLFFLIKFYNKIIGLQKKFGSIIDVDGERTKIQETIETLKAEREKVNNEFIDKKEKLIAEYDNAHKIYERLQKEITLLEESAEMIEFGVYKPHFDFDASDAYRQQLERLRENEKEMIRSDRAVKCDTEWTVSGSKADGKKMIRQASKLMLRAFNGECDAALLKVRWDNVLKMEERVNKALETINKSGEVNKIYITHEYLDLKIRYWYTIHRLPEFKEFNIIDAVNRKKTV